MPPQSPESQTRVTQQVAASESPESERRTRPGPTAVVLTALEVEFEAMRGHLSDIEGTVHPSGTFYDIGTLGKWSVALAEIGAGNSQASMEVERAVQHFSAQVVMFVGVAGGVKDVALGDVVVADKVVGYERGKDGDSFRPRADSAPCSYRAVQLARAIRRESNRELDVGFRTHIGALAAGEKVVASATSFTAELFRANYGDVLAVEMEGRGFLIGSAAQPGVDAIVVRGISDLLDGKAASDAAGGQSTASMNAARIAAALLTRLLPVENAYLADPGEDSSTHTAPTAWEYNLLAGRFSEAIDAISSRRRDLVLGLPVAGVTKVMPSAFLERFRLELAILHKWTLTVEPLVSDFLSEALGPPGFPGDAAKIAYAAERLGRIYSEIVDWGLRWRSVVIDDEWTPVLQKLADAAITLACDFEQFRDDIVDLARGLNEGVVDDDSTVHITLKLSDPGLSGIPETVAALLGVDAEAHAPPVSPEAPDVRIVVSAGQIFRPGAKPEHVINVTARNHGPIPVYLVGGVSMSTADPRRNLWVGQDAMGQHLYQKELKPGDSLDVVILASELAQFDGQIKQFFYTDKIGRRFFSTLEATAEAFANIEEVPE